MATAQSNYIWGTGRRKTAVARVRIREGTGQFFVNNLPIENYFVEVTHATDAKSPLTLTDMGGRVDVFVNVKGSGKSSQSGAVVMGLARALKEFRPDLDEALRASGFLTRDPRMVERKKFGQKKARKRFQFSKR